MRRRVAERERQVTADTRAGADQLAGRFARDTRVRRVAEGVWEGEFSPAWNIGQAPNGGYAMAVGARALAAALPHPDPLVVTAYYLSRPAPGPVRCEVEVLRVGKATSTGMVRMVQGGATVIQLLGTCTDLAANRGVSHCAVPVPEMPGYADCVDTPVADNIALRRQLIQRMTPDHVRALEGQAAPVARWLGWTAFADGAPIDLFALLLFADAMPPPAFALYGSEGWVPTLELSVQLHAHPAPGPIRCRFETPLITRGLVDEDGWLWDSEGRLVALVRQTAKLRARPRGGL
jgi:acyl-CoA thioesterase